MILSILISSKPDRRHLVNQLVSLLVPQIKERLTEVEVRLALDDRNITDKRNNLLKEASGEYVWMIRDQDLLGSDAVEQVLKATSFGTDMIAISGVSKATNSDPIDFQVRKEYKSDLTMITGDKPILMKSICCITPVKREIALKHPFVHGENWSVIESIQTQYVIEKPIYHIRELR